LGKLGASGTFWWREGVWREEAVLVGPLKASRTKVRMGPGKTQKGLVQWRAGGKSFLMAAFKGQRRRYYINQVEDALETRTRLRKSGDLAETRSRKVARLIWSSRR
jgi:hypothetical protein